MINEFFSIFFGFLGLAIDIWSFSMGVDMIIKHPNFQGLPVSGEIPHDAKPCSNYGNAWGYGRSPFFCV